MVLTIRACTHRPYTFNAKPNSKSHLINISVINKMYCENKNQIR